MKTSQAFIIGISTLLLSAVVSSAEIKITVGHNTGDDATTQFKFSNVPSPATNDAATKAKFTIVSGDPDDNSADITCLTTASCPRKRISRMQIFSSRRIRKADGFRWI